MFTDIEKKLKGVAIVNLIFGIVIALACLVIMEEDGILIASAAVLTSLISSWFIYAFAELLENTKRISHALQVVFAEDISKDLERQKKIEGRCGRCVHFALCGGGFRTRAAFANGHWYGSDPGCYLTEEEISTPLPEIK